MLNYLLLSYKNVFFATQTQVQKPVFNTLLINICTSDSNIYSIIPYLTIAMDIIQYFALISF